MPEGNLPDFNVPTTPKPMSGPQDVWNQYFGDPTEAQYMIEDIRQRHLAVLQADGKEFFWLKRMLSGTECAFWNKELQQCQDPLNTQSACYNTRWVGGYHMPLIIKVAKPTAIKQTVRQEAGMMIVQPMKAWTVWTPRVLDRDFIVDIQTGERWELQNVQEGGPWRGLIVTQFFDLRPMQLGADYGMNFPVPLIVPR